MMRRTKIICTLGPATDDKEVLKGMMEAGMNVARLNFSHGSHEEHKQRMDLVKACRAELGLPIGIMLDTKGPEIRTKTYKNGKIEIQDGQTFTLTTRDVEGDESIVSISYEGLPNDVKPGTRILIDDGLIAFEVQEVKDGTDIVCRALNAGPLSNRKSINVPGIKLNMPFISDKDRADIIFGLEQGIDFIAASFTRTKQDILDIKDILKEYGQEDVLHQHPRDPLRVLGPHGRARRPRRRGTLLRAARDPEAPDQDGHLPGQARRHRHPDARLHVQKPARHPRRGLRRGKRRL